jgi:methyltransferase
MSYHHLILLAVALLRAWELAFSWRRLREAQAQGGAVLIPEPVYPVMVAVHAGWLGGGLLETWLRGYPYPGALALPALLLWMAALALRGWVLAVMREHWNVRLIERANQPVIATGPFRYVRHPNYLAVIVEIAAVPLLLGAYVTAALGSLANGLVLVWRIRREEAYLLDLPAYRAAFEHKKRLIPGVF